MRVVCATPRGSGYFRGGLCEARAVALAAEGHTVPLGCVIFAGNRPGSAAGSPQGVEPGCPRFRRGAPATESITLTVTIAPDGSRSGGNVACSLAAPTSTWMRSRSHFPAGGRHARPLDRHAALSRIRTRPRRFFRSVRKTWSRAGSVSSLHGVLRRTPELPKGIHAPGSRAGCSLGRAALRLRTIRRAGRCRISRSRSRVFQRQCLRPTQCVHTRPVPSLSIVVGAVRLLPGRIVLGDEHLCRWLGTMSSSLWRWDPRRRWSPARCMHAQSALVRPAINPEHRSHSDTMPREDHKAVCCVVHDEHILVFTYRDVPMTVTGPRPQDSPVGCAAIVSSATCGWRTPASVTPCADAATASLTPALSPVLRPTGRRTPADARSCRCDRRGNIRPAHRGVRPVPPPRGG